MSNYFDAIVREVAACKTRNDAAALYARAMRSWNNYDSAAWVALNEAIMDKWSRAGLIYVKEKAWKLAEKTL